MEILDRDLFRSRRKRRQISSALVFVLVLSIGSFTFASTVETDAPPPFSVAAAKAAIIELPKDAARLIKRAREALAEIRLPEIFAIEFDWPGPFVVAARPNDRGSVNAAQLAVSAIVVPTSPVEEPASLPQEEETSTSPQSPTTTTIIHQTINQPVVERIIQSPVQVAPIQTGVSEATLSARIQELASAVNQRIQNAFLGAAQTARVENLSAITVSGVSGLTDADIPDGITASNYLPLAGGALTGTLTGTDLTLSGNLTVSGAQTLSGAITVPYLVATTTTASTFAGNVGIGTTTPWGKLSVTNTGTGPSFVVEDSASPDTTPFLIDASGNVGIGTASPGANLDVLSASGNTNIRIRGNSASSALLQFGNSAGTNHWAIYETVGLGDVMGKFNFYDYTAAAVRMTIDASGNVGIGMTTPDAKLDISGSSSGAILEQLRLRNVGTGDGTGSRLGFGPSTNFDVAYVQSRYSAGSGGWGIDFGTGGGSSSDGQTRMVVTGAGNVGVATTSPWRTLSVTGTVGFDGLTGNFGTGSLCLDANKQVVYNAGSDACLSSLRSTKHDIAPLDLDALAAIIALHPVSFVYNGDASSTVRYGFIADDTEVIDRSLATHDAHGDVSGIDDRAILSIVVKSVQALFGQIRDVVATVAGFAQRFVSDEVVARNKLCVEDICVTRDQFLRIVEQGGQVLSPVANSPATVDAPADAASDGAAGADLSEQETEFAADAPSIVADDPNGEDADLPQETDAPELSADVPQIEAEAVDVPITDSASAADTHSEPTQGSESRLTRRRVSITIGAK